jgi:lysophospholipase L1-like esterase
MKRIALSIAFLAACLVALDLLMAAGCQATALSERVVEIQHPTTLLAKLDRLRTAPHPKVVLLGDSLVYGGILEEFGDADWREHGFGPQLAAELAEDGAPFVMNLGINGALPADLEALARLVVACDVDWIVLDIHLRPFSRDFSDPAQQMSRPWLRDVEIDNDGRAGWRPAGNDPMRWLTARIADQSAIVRNRTMIQENLLSTSPAKHPALRPAEPVSEKDAEIQGMVKLAQLKGRLRQLDLDPPAPQPAALQRMLRDLSARGQKHVVFYAKENPDLLPDVMEADEHAASYGHLVRLVREAQGPSGVFVPPLAELEGRHFLDFTHVNAEGYRLLARRLAAAIRQGDRGGLGRPDWR